MKPSAIESNQLRTILNNSLMHVFERDANHWSIAFKRLPSERKYRQALYEYYNCGATELIGSEPLLMGAKEAISDLIGLSLAPQNDTTLRFREGGSYYPTDPLHNGGKL